MWSKLKGGLIVSQNSGTNLIDGHKFKYKVAYSLLFFLLLTFYTPLKPYGTWFLLKKSVTSIHGSSCCWAWIYVNGGMLKFHC